VSGLRASARGDGGVRFPVRVQPRGSRDAIEGVHDGALKVRLSAPPVDGAANEALIALLANRLSVRRRDVRIVTGASSRVKVVEVDGVGVDRVRGLAGER
jgi:uncharacterized protein (TIGR00251 family)